MKRLDLLGVVHVIGTVDHAAAPAASEWRRRWRRADNVPEVTGEAHARDGVQTVVEEEAPAVQVHWLCVRVAGRLFGVGGGGLTADAHRAELEQALQHAGLDARHGRVLQATLCGVDGGPCLAEEGLHDGGRGVDGDSAILLHHASTSTSTRPAEHTHMSINRPTG